MAGTLQGVPKSVPCVNKNNSANFYSSRKIRYFLKPETCANVLNLFRIKQDEFCKNERSAEKESVFSIFTHVFAYLSHFTIFFFVEQINQSNTWDASLGEK